MGHNLHGDVPQEHIELAQELLEMEAHFDANVTTYGPSMCARVFLCLAHDYYEISDDEKGYDLIQKANRVCPGYFENEIKTHIDQDPEFAYLVESLTHKILAIARSIVGE